MFRGRIIHTSHRVLPCIIRKVDWSFILLLKRFEAFRWIIQLFYIYVLESSFFTPSSIFQSVDLLVLCVVNNMTIFLHLLLVLHLLLNFGLNVVKVSFADMGWRENVVGFDIGILNRKVTCCWIFPKLLSRPFHTAAWIIKLFLRLLEWLIGTKVQWLIRAVFSIIMVIICSFTCLNGRLFYLI